MNMCKKIVGGNIYVRSKFSCVHLSHDLCACARAHSLEGTLHITSHFLLFFYSVLVWFGVSS